MAKTQNILFALCLCFSIVVNIVSVSTLYRKPGSKGLSWTEKAAAEAEAVADVWCSGHGRAFLDGFDVDGKPICECNACYGGHDCSEFLPGCVVDADSSDPLFLEPFWMQHAVKGTIVVPGWHRISYHFNDGSIISKALETQIRKLHEVTANAITKGKFIIFGAGATQLLHAALHALSSSDPSSPSRVVASTPYNHVYREEIEFFNSSGYKFEGDTFSCKNEEDSQEHFVEFVTSPNNPDGQLKKGVLQGPYVKRIHDLSYYWPHYTAIPAPADEDIMIFTLSKLTGHGGSRFGWAIVNDEAVYQRMLTYMILSTYGVSRETQLRVLKLLNVVLESGGRELYDFGYKTMRNRWKQLSRTLSMSKRFSMQELVPLLYCSYYEMLRGPSPAFAWLKCEREEDEDCNAVLKSVNVTGRNGILFGVESRYVRLSLVKGHGDFDLLLERMEMLVSAENESGLTMKRSGITTNVSMECNASYHLEGFASEIVEFDFESIL